MPNQPKTKARSIRVPDELWEAVKERAAERGEDATAVAIRAFKRYVQDTGRSRVAGVPAVHSREKV